MEALNSVALLLLLVQAFGANLCAQESVQINGHTLFLDCRGTASGPTVILLAGGGGTTDTWNKVQPAVSTFARVCSYDRAGLGKSSPLHEPQTAAEIVNDLALLLKQSKIPVPYLLVGHSIGGLYARRFDERFDSKVAAMVLVDSSHEEQIWRFARDEPSALAEYPNWKDEVATEAEGFLPPGRRLQWHFTKPLIVLEHGVPPEPVWHAMQEDLASRSPVGRLITATGSSHYIQKLDPELVIESIRTVLLQSQSPHQ
jgi:pimeloyl-ACP methyl ester carboxylesterase